MNLTNLNVVNVNCDEIIAIFDKIFKGKKNADDIFNCLRFTAEGTIDRGVYWRLLVLLTIPNNSEESKKVEIENYTNLLKQIDFSILHNARVFEHFESF
jgi:hypothetical protein